MAVGIGKICSIFLFNSISGTGIFSDISKYIQILFHKNVMWLKCFISIFLHFLYQRGWQVKCMCYLKLRFNVLCITAWDYFGTDSFNFSSAIPFLGLFLAIKLLFIYHFLLEICYSSSNFKTRLQSYCFHRKPVIVVYRKRIYTYLNVTSYFYAYSVIYTYILLQKHDFMISGNSDGNMNIPTGPKMFLCNITSLHIQREIWIFNAMWNGN
jgi:hypothetical protein